MITPALCERTIRGLHEHLFHRLPQVDKTAGVLDIGCGTGAWLQRLANAGYSSLHGIDLDTRHFQAAGATCSHANLDSDDLGLGQRRFGLITAIELVEHLECPGRLFQHVSKHLEPGGTFLMTTPNVHSLLARLRFFVTGELQQFDRYGDPTHINPIYLPCLERTLARHGLFLENRSTYPPRAGGLNSKWTSVFAARLARAFADDPLPGDILCVTIVSRVED